MSGIEDDIKGRFSGISEDVGKLRSIIASMKNGIELGDPIETLEWCEAEIIRLRAENKELRASYERVEKYGQILLIETGGLKEANERLLAENERLKELPRCEECGIKLVPDNICSDCFHSKD